MKTTALMLGVAWLAGIADAQTATRTVQQDFDAATALDAQPDATAAAAAWQALEARVRPGSRSAAIVAARKGDALFRLGRYDEADAALRKGLAGMPAGDPSLRADRARTWLLLGTLAHNTLDYAGAAGAFAEVEALEEQPIGKLRAQLALAQVQTFVDPAAAGKALNRAEASLKLVPDPDHVARAMIRRRRAELLLNMNQIAAGRDMAVAAVTDMGGLSERTSLEDVAVRADAALAFVLLNDTDRARRYMAMTGAGRLPKAAFRPAAQMDPPECGGEAGLKPADVAIVQFSIADDGTVTRVEPIYAAGGGRVALEFARSVRDWSWGADELKVIPPFYRTNVRVEMRCSTAFARPSITDGLDDRLSAWLDANGAPVEHSRDGGVAARGAAERAALATAEAKAPDSLQTMAAAWTLSRNAAVGREERVALLMRALRIAEQRKAPAIVRLALDLPARTGAVVEGWKRGVFDRIADGLLAQPDYGADPRARAAIQLMRVSDWSARRRDDASILAILRPIAEDERMPKDDPLRVGALVRIASAEQRRGNLTGARAAFDATGLAASQCAVLDAVPRMVSNPGADIFPMEALAWGFGGWVKMQLDIGADGRAKDVRALLAYPAFTFSRAGKDYLTQARFQQTFRPDGSSGCGGLMRNIVFMQPDTPRG